MQSARVIPVLLIQDRRLVKTVRFNNPTYIGDAINALRIFSEKQVDELAILDISAAAKRSPDFEYVGQLVSECFMPLAYGGGIQTPEHATILFSMGVDKVILGEAALKTPGLVTEIASRYGAQSVVVSADVGKNWMGRDAVFVSRGRVNSKTTPSQYAIDMQNAGAGEIILQSIERDGTGKGFDLALITKVCSGLTIPVIALGGASKLEDFSKAVAAGASAVAAGSMFVFNGPHRAVLINYPEPRRLDALFKA